MRVLIGKPEFAKPEGHFVKTYKSPYLSFAIRQSKHANSVPFHKHDYDEFIYSPSGVQELEWKNAACLVKESLTSKRLLWTPAGVSHAASWNDTWYSIGILLNEDIMGECLTFDGLSRPTTTVFFNASRQLQTLLHLCLREEWLTRLEQPLFAQALSKMLASELVVCYRSTASIAPETNADQFDLSKLTEYVDSNIQNLLSVEDLAHLVHLSPYYFSRLFKARTGLTPYQFVLNRRLMLGLNLLPDESLSLGDIAQLVGFRSPSSFSKAFRKVYKISPGQYRANMTT